MGGCVSCLSEGSQGAGNAIVVSRTGGSHTGSADASLLLPNAVQVSSAIDSDSHRPAFPRKILLIQLARVQDALDAMERCVASVGHPGLRQRLAKPVYIVKATLRDLERLGTSVPLAQLIDSADALCMLGVGISAITQQCHLTDLPAALLFVSHMESCARGISADLHAPLADAAVAFKPHPRRSHSPFTASLANSLHLWHLALAWASAHAVIPRQAHATIMQSPGSSSPPHLASMPFIPGAALSSTVEEGTDPSLDAAEAVDKLERHVLALVDRECTRADAPAQDVQQSSPVLLADSSAPRQFVRPQLLRLACDASLAPSGCITHPAAAALLSDLYLTVELVPFEAVYAVLRAGLDAACSPISPQPVPGVVEPRAALELLTALQQEIADELERLTMCCTGCGVPIIAPTDASAESVEGVAMPAHQALAQEMQRARARVLDGTSLVYVGAIARAFPAHLTFEEALSCIGELAQSHRVSKATVDEGMEWDTAAFVTAGSRRSSAMVSASDESMMRGLLSTAGTSYYSPRTTVTDTADWALTSDTSGGLSHQGVSGSGSAGGGAGGSSPRLPSVARLLAMHGGWKTDVTPCELTRCELPCGDGDGLRPVAPPRFVGVLEGSARRKDVMAVAAEVRKGSPVSLICGVEGIGKTHCLYQATVALLASRSWASVKYVALPSDTDHSLLPALCAAQQLSIPAFAPAGYRIAALARSFPTAQPSGLIIDEILCPSMIPQLVVLAEQLHRENSCLQVVLAARVDTGASAPTSLPSVHLAPLPLSAAEMLLSQAVVSHVRQRVGLGEDGTACGMAGWLVNGRTTSSMDLDGVKSPVDLSDILQPTMELARQGLQLCRGVPLLLHVLVQVCLLPLLHCTLLALCERDALRGHLVQVSLACVISPEAPAATAAFEENLRVLQRSMAAPLRLTSLVVRQVLACMSAQFGQITMAGVCRASALTLRVLETCPVYISTAAEAVPLTVRLARGSLDEASLPSALSPPRRANLKSPAAAFLSAAVLWHAGCMHYAHALADRTSQPLLEQVQAMRGQQPLQAVEDVMRWLHMALTLQAACLLHPDTVWPLREALQDIGKQNTAIRILAQACQAWLLMDAGNPEDALLACPAAVQPANLSAATKFAVAHARAVALVRLSTSQRHAADGAPALHQALDRLNAAIHEAVTKQLPPGLMQRDSADAAPLHATAHRAAATCSPFVQPMLTGLLRVLILRELMAVHQKLRHAEACKHVQGVMIALCNTMSSLAMEGTLGGYWTAADGEGSRSASSSSGLNGSKSVGAVPQWQAQLKSVATTRLRPAFCALLKASVRADELGAQRLLPAGRASETLGIPLVQRPFLMRTLLAHLCEREAAVSLDHTQRIAYLVQGLSALPPAPPAESASQDDTSSALVPAPQDVSRSKGHIVDVVRSGLRAGMLSDARCGAVRMLISLAQSLASRWPDSGLGRDAALVAAGLMLSGRLDGVPGATAAWQSIREICIKGHVEPMVLKCLQTILARAKRTRPVKRGTAELHIGNTLFIPAAVPTRRPLPVLTSGSRRPTSRYMPPDLQPHPPPNHTSASNYSPAAAAAAVPLPAPQASFHSSAASNETTAEGSISLAGDLSVERSADRSGDIVDTNADCTAAQAGWGPAIPDHKWTRPISLPGTQPDSPTGEDTLGSMLAPAASSEVYVSAAEDTPTSSSDGHVGSPFADGAEGDFTPSLTPRVTTFMGGPLPTVTEEPHMEDGVSRQASREGSSGLLALTAQNSASVSSTPVAFGSVATQSGSLHSRASPRDAAPSSTDSGHVTGAPLSGTGSLLSRPRSTDSHAQTGTIASLPEHGGGAPSSTASLPSTPVATGTPPGSAMQRHAGSPEGPALPVDLTNNISMPDASGSWLYGQAMAVVNGMSPGRDSTVDSVTEHLIQSEGSMSHSRTDGTRSSPLRPYPDSTGSANISGGPSSTPLSASVDLAMSKFEAERHRFSKPGSGRRVDNASAPAALVIDERLAAAALARLHVRDGWAALGLSNPHIVTTGVPGESPGRGSGNSGDAGMTSETAGASTSTGNGTPRKSLDSHSDMSLVVDSEGRPMACLRNQPRLPRTAFLSTAPSAMLTANLVDQGPLSTHTTPRSGATAGSATTVEETALTVTVSPGASPNRGSSAFDSALLHRSDEEELRPAHAGPQEGKETIDVKSPQQAYAITRPVTQRAFPFISHKGIVPQLPSFVTGIPSPAEPTSTPRPTSPPPIRRGGPSPTASEPVPTTQSTSSNSAVPSPAEASQSTAAASPVGQDLTKPGAQVVVPSPGRSPRPAVPAESRIITTGASPRSSAPTSSLLPSSSATAPSASPLGNSGAPFSVPPPPHRRQLHRPAATVTTGAVASAAGTSAYADRAVDSMYSDSISAPLSATEPGSMTSRSAPAAPVARPQCTITTGAEHHRSQSQPTTVTTSSGTHSSMPLHTSSYTPSPPASMGRPALPLQMPAVTTGTPGHPHGTAVVTGAVGPPPPVAAARPASPSASPRGYIPIDSLPSSTRSSVNLLFDRGHGGSSAVRGAIDQLPQSHSSNRDLSNTVTTGAVSNPSSPSQPRSVGGQVSQARHHPATIPRLPLHTITTGILSSSTRAPHYVPSPPSAPASSTMSITSPSGAAPAPPVAALAPPVTSRRPVLAPASLDSARAKIAGATVTSGAVEVRGSAWPRLAPWSVQAVRSGASPPVSASRPRQQAQPPVVVAPANLDTALSAVLSPRFSRGSGSPQLSPRELQRSLSADHADSIAEVLSDTVVSSPQGDTAPAARAPATSRSTGGSPSPSAAAAVARGSSGSCSASGSVDAAAWRRVSNASGSLAPASSGPLLPAQPDIPVLPAPSELLSASRPTAPVTTGAPEPPPAATAVSAELFTGSSRDQSSGSGGGSGLTARASQGPFSNSGGSLIFADSAPWELHTASSAVASPGATASQALSTQLTGLHPTHTAPSGLRMREQYTMAARALSLSSGEAAKAQPEAAADASHISGAAASGGGSAQSGSTPSPSASANPATLEPPAAVPSEPVHPSGSDESAKSAVGSPGSSSYGSGTMPCSGSDGASAACNSISIAQLPSAAAAESSTESPGGRRPLKQNSLDLGSHPGRLRVGEESTRASLQRWEDQRSLKAQQALLGGGLPPTGAANGLTVVPVAVNGAKGAGSQDGSIERERVAGEGSQLSLRGDESELGLAAVMTLSPRVPEQAGGEYDLSLTGPSDIMSSAVSSVAWRENESAAAHWRENPLSSEHEHDPHSSGESPRLRGVGVPKQGAEWMNNPLAAGDGVAQAPHAVKSG
eukprot:jgi/Ulvmu1/5624/UM023_0163.1